jgi:hypothetical protein
MQINIKAVAVWVGLNLSTVGVAPLSATVPGVCVFDYDDTLSCAGAFAAVATCRAAGFGLAVNTARHELLAKAVIPDGLREKGFDEDFIKIAANQIGLEGPFQYRVKKTPESPQEQIMQAKSFGMRHIAQYYGIKADDQESRKIILFDDQPSNYIEMQPSPLEEYANEPCRADENGLCYADPQSAPLGVSFPRNWKIYRAQWIGYSCERWADSVTAAKDAADAIQAMTTGAPRN